MKTLNEYATAIHTTAKAKGWWNPAKSIHEVLMLVITEIAEATEEVRNGKPFVYFNTPTGVVTHQDLGWGYPNLKVGSEIQKPEGEGIEVADAAIRLLDFAGYLGLNVSEETFETALKYMHTTPPPDADKPLKWHFLFTNAVVHLGHEKYSRHVSALGPEMAILLAEMSWYTESKGIPLVQLMRSKMEYNETRSHRHGRKAY